MIRFRAGWMVLLLALGPHQLMAQRWVADSSVERLAWGSVNVLVRADTAKGVRLWAETSSLGYAGKPLAFAASFDPDSTTEWLAQAEGVASYRSPPRDSSVQALQTRPLRARDSSMVILLRRRKKAKWADRATLLFVDPGERHPWTIEAKLDEAEKFIRVFFEQSSRSGLHPDSTAIPEANPFAETTCPVPLPGNPMPEYPASLHGQAGAVWMTFMVRADGTTDEHSFRAVLFDHPAFADAAFEALRSSRYRPATINGRPVPVVVSQRVVFKTR